MKLEVEVSRRQFIRFGVPAVMFVTGYVANDISDKRAEQIALACNRGNDDLCAGVKGVNRLNGVIRNIGGFLTVGSGVALAMLHSKNPFQSE